MTGPVHAAIDERAVWIRSGWDRAIPSRFRAWTTIDGFDVTLLVLVGDRGPGATEVTVEQPEAGHGPAVTLSMLRKVTVDQIIRDALAKLALPASSAEGETGNPGTFRVEGVDGTWGGQGTPEPGRGRDTSPDRLADVARIYQAAIAAGRPPVKAVEKELKYSRSTAGRLVGQARKAGLLAPTTQGKTSDAPVDVSTARPDYGPSIFRNPSGPRPWEQERGALVQPIVAAIVTSHRGVLIGRRHDGKPPWTFIAGEQDAVQDENPADTAVREVKEETGLQVQAGDVIGERVHPKTHRRMIYIAAVPTLGTDVFVGDEEELAEVRWVSLAEADELLPGMFEPVREHLARELGQADKREEDLGADDQDG